MIEDLTKPWFENKEIVKELIIEEYGEEYRNLISEKIDNTYYNFSSTPDEDYKYLENNKKKISRKEKKKILKNYKEYLVLNKSLLEKSNNLMYEFAKKVLNIEDVKCSKQQFTEQFMNKDFNYSTIDYFNETNEILLNDPYTPDYIKVEITLNRNKLLSILDNPSTVTKENVNKIITFRDKLERRYKCYLVTHLESGKQLDKDIKEKWHKKLKQPSLATLYFIRNPYSSYTISTKENNNTSNFIRLPITTLLNVGVKSLDTSLIHELIHRIEKEKNTVSFIKQNDENDIFNEVRTQRLALKITKKMHDLDIFMYDEKDYKLEGQSTYESMFPLIGHFIDQNEEVFKELAITNNTEGLKNKFGTSWSEFSRKVDSTYNKIRSISDLGINNISINTDTIMSFAEATKQLNSNYKVKQLLNN